MLNTEVVLPYIRSPEEWLEVVKTVFEPFAAINNVAASYPTTLTNRAEIDHFGYRVHPNSYSADRRRLTRGL